MNNIDRILDKLSGMPYDKRDSFAYFCAGMLYGMSVLEVDEDATARPLDLEVAAILTISTHPPYAGRDKLNREYFTHGRGFSMQLPIFSSC